MTRESTLFGLDDRFVLEAAVGAGSMGTVYRARDRATGTTVAIKRLRSMDPADVRRFEREFAILRKLRHPAIVACWETGKTADGACYIAMEWLEGESLRARLRRSELTLDETLTLALRVAAGLAHAHELGIVHRDVKPANVFLEGERADGAKLVDFGIARHVAAGETLTRAGDIVGTPGYVSPEQIRGGRVDQRSDVYAVGCLLFRCLAGRAVFEDDNVLEMLVRVSRDQAPALSEVRAGLPAELTGLVDRMLEREPGDRPADAAEVLRELEALVRSTKAPRRGAAEPEPDFSARPPARRIAPPARADEDTDGASAPSRSTALAAANTTTARRLSPRAKLGTAGAILATATAALVTAYSAREAPGTTGTPPTASTETTEPFGSPADHIGAGARSAWGSIRLGARAAALRGMTARAQHGSASASEHLWLALLSSPGEDAKRQQREASIRVHELTLFERAVLDAAEPLLTAPADFAKANRALTEVADKSRSPELWLVLARLRTQLNDRAAANAALDRASTEPWAVAALVERTYVDREFFDVVAARARATSCIDQRPAAVDCVAFLSRRAALDGDCATMDAFARRWIDADPDDPRAYEMLAFALAARGDKDAALREAFEQKWARVDEPDRAAVQLRDSVMLESLRGRFDKATVHAQSAVDRLGADAPLLKRLAASFTLLAVASETEDRRLVREISSRILDRASAATPPTPSEAAYFLLFVSANEYPEPDARWGEVRAAAFARYNEYVAAQGSNVRPFQRVLPWIVGYAAGASSEARLKSAYDALPRYEPLPPAGIALDDDLVIGRVLAANGERERGFGYLRGVARSCLALENPFAVVRALKVMGELHEAANEDEAAREAYEGVLARWGNAVPRSRSAEAAKAGLARIAAKRGRSGAPSLVRR